MASTFKLIAQDCGLTMTGAASFLDVKLDTARSWWTGRRTCPESVIDELLVFSIKQDLAAHEGAMVIKNMVQQNGAPESVELGLVSDDYEARALGWPSADAHAAVLRKTIKLLPHDLAILVKIVPRGSTPATAAAEII